jgi:hypothetical protein
MTPWALGLIPTVRIGAGAWRKLANTRESGDTDQANTPIHDAQKGTQEQKEKRPEAFRKELWDGAQTQEPAHVMIEKPNASARDSALLRCASRDQHLLKGKT